MVYGKDSSRFIDFYKKVDELKDQLQDAEDALDESYLKVNIESIGNNASQITYQEVYLENIDDKEVVVNKLNEEIDELLQKYVEDCNEINLSIESLVKRIAKISAE